MNGEHPSTEHLQRSYDGDLSAAEASAVHSHVAGCAQCKRDLDSLTRLGSLVRMAAEDAGAQPDFSRMFGEIERAIVDTPVVPLRKPAGASPRMRLLYRAAPALGAVALAAAALLMVYRPDNTPNEGEEPSNELSAAAPHSEVVEVDFGSNAGTVFDIPLSDGSSIPVVWIDDDDDEE